MRSRDTCDRKCRGHNRLPPPYRRRTRYPMTLSSARHVTPRFDWQPEEAGLPSFAGSPLVCLLRQFSDSASLLAGLLGPLLLLQRVSVRIVRTWCVGFVLLTTAWEGWAEGSAERGPRSCVLEVLGSVRTYSASATEVNWANC